MSVAASGRDRITAEDTPQRQRAFRTRTRSGCITCKIRRVKCDEQRPSCTRCTSTGRHCDGYADNAERAAGSRNHVTRPTSIGLQTKQHTLSPPRNLTAPLPRKNTQELRCYRFFLDVTAPAIAGVFDADFWLTYVPQTCHLDLAVWHAVVSIGAVHENYLANPTSTARDSSTTAFAMQQSNAAISHLVHARSSRSLPEQKVRALTASVLFAYQCSIQRLYSQSDVHLKAAKSLITELEATNRFRAADRATLRRESQPVPYESLMSIVANLQIHSQALQSDNMNEALTSLRDVDVNTAWRYYSAPAHTKSLELCQHGRGMPSRATSANLARAGQAFESLLTEMVADSLQSSAEVARLSLEGDQKLLATLVGREKPYTRAFRELSNAIGIFVADTTIECSCFGPSPRHTAHKQQRKAIDALRLYHATCYPLFLDKPFNDNRFPELYHPLLQTQFSDSPTSGPKEALARHFSHALDVVESLLQDSSPRERPTSTIDFMPTLPTTMPLFVIANVSGVSLDLRRRVIALLRQYTRHEVLWDTSFVAALTELIMMQEDMAGETEDAVIATPLTNKVHSVNVTHIEAHAARVMLQTWDEWISNDPGHEMTLTW